MILLGTSSQMQLWTLTALNVEYLIRKWSIKSIEYRHTTPYMYVFSTLTHAFMIACNFLLVWHSGANIFHHEKYWRRCNFLRHNRELYSLLSPGETRSRFSFYYSHVSRRDRDYILLFSCFETRTRNTDWMSQGRARKNVSQFSRDLARTRILADLWYKWTLNDLNRWSCEACDNQVSTNHFTSQIL